MIKRERGGIPMNRKLRITLAAEVLCPFPFVPFLSSATLKLHIDSHPREKGLYRISLW